MLDLWLSRYEAASDSDTFQISQAESAYNPSPGGTATSSPEGSRPVRSRQRQARPSYIEGDDYEELIGQFDVDGAGQDLLDPDDSDTEDDNDDEDEEDGVDADQHGNPSDEEADGSDGPAGNGEISSQFVRLRSLIAVAV